MVEEKLALTPDEQVTSDGEFQIAWADGPWKPMCRVVIIRSSDGKTRSEYFFRCVNLVSRQSEDVDSPTLALSSSKGWNDLWSDERKEPDTRRSFEVRLDDEGKFCVSGTIVYDDEGREQPWVHCLSTPHGDIRDIDALNSLPPQMRLIFSDSRAMEPSTQPITAVVSSPRRHRRS